MKQMDKQEQLWEAQKVKLKLLFASLKDEDFQYDYGNKEVMLTNLQQKLGKTREELNACLTQL